VHDVKSGEGTDRGPCLVTDLGIMGIPEADRFMAAVQKLRAVDEISDLLLFMAHPKTVAVGLRDRHVEHPRDLLVTPQRLEREGIALTRSVRGGGITYHWPGQVVCYPVLALGADERSIPGYMFKLEEVGIGTLRRFGVDAARRRDAAAYVGLWTSAGKIVSMGVRISNWVTSFGFVINVHGDHRESQYVRPCGLEGVHLVTLEEILGNPPSKSSVVDAIKETFIEVFDRTLQEMSGAVAEKIRSTESRAENH
jgi:lipoate-protein ligase B